MNPLLNSRKFLIMLVDVIVSLITYFTGKYLDASAAKDILFLIGALQPVVLFVIGFIGIQNVTAMKAQAEVSKAIAYSEATKG